MLDALVTHAPADGQVVGAAFTLRPQLQMHHATIACRVQAVITRLLAQGREAIVNLNEMPRQVLFGVGNACEIIAHDFGGYGQSAEEVACGKCMTNLARRQDDSNGCGAHARCGDIDGATNHVGITRRGEAMVAPLAIDGAHVAICTAKRGIRGSRVFFDGALHERLRIATRRARKRKFMALGASQGATKTFVAGDVMGRVTVRIVSNGPRCRKNDAILHVARDTSNTNSAKSSRNGLIRRRFGRVAALAKRRAFNGKRALKCRMRPGDAVQ